MLRKKNADHHVTTLRYLDSEMLLEISGTLNRGIAFERQVEEVTKQWKEASLHGTVPLDQFFPVNVGGSASRGSSKITNVKEVREMSLKSLFGELFNDPRFHKFPIAPNKSLEEARIRLLPDDTIHGDEIGKMIELSGQIVRTQSDGSSDGLVDILVGPKSTGYQLQCQAVAMAKVSEMDPQLDAFLVGGPWFRVLGQLHGGPGRHLRVNLKERGEPVGLFDRLRSAGVGFDEERFDDYVYTKMQLTLFAIFT
jgi:hypothetical protein